MEAAADPGLGDSFRGRLTIDVSPARIRELSVVSAWRAPAHIALEWLGVIAAVVLCEHFWNPVLYVLAVMWIGARQHALGVLMHDGTHYRLTPSRRWNEILGEVFLAWPLFITQRGFRASHTFHHRNTWTEEDPSLPRGRKWVFPKSRTKMLLLFAQDVVGAGVHELFEEDVIPSNQKAPTDWRYAALRIAFYAIAISTVFLLHGWRIVLLYWVIPIATWLKTILRMRTIVEHFTPNAPSEKRIPMTDMTLQSQAVLFAGTRTARTTLFERFFVAPKNVGYHLDHHIYPSVPFYRLPQLHAELMTKAAFKAHAHVTRSYWAALKECVRG